jgi:hypothetical protein
LAHTQSSLEAAPMLAVEVSTGHAVHCARYVRFSRYRFPATDLNSKATSFGMYENQSATFAFNFSKTI